jgi:hypothetical protein
MSLGCRKGCRAGDERLRGVDLPLSTRVLFLICIEIKFNIASAFAMREFEVHTSPHTKSNSIGSFTLDLNASRTSGLHDKVQN